MAIEKSANIRRVLLRQCAAAGVPGSGVFELTPRCNLSCKMCYVRLTPEQMAPIGRELTAQEWLDIGRKATDAGMFFLLITGGEPTLRSDFPEIYEGLAQMGLSISINTNGTLLTPELKELWHRLPPATVNVTLYGTSRGDYEALCGNPSAFDAVVEGLRWLKREGILVHLNTTITPINRDKWLELEEFAKDLELELRMTTYCFPPIRRSECSSCPEFSRLSPEEAAELNLRDIYYREGMDSIKRHAAHMSTPPLHDCDLSSEEGEAIRCMAGHSQFWMTWDGRMTPCGMLPVPETRPMAQGFINAWNTLCSAAAAIRLCPDCVSCPDRQTCMNCAAVTFTETGRFDGKPEYMCRLTQAYREKLVKMAEEGQMND